MQPTAALLERSAGWAERAVAADEPLLTEGDAPGTLFVLVEGHLVVRRGGEVLAVIDQPGACVGEMALLLDRDHSATVSAAAVSRVRVLPDAGAVLLSSPDLLVPVARILASRLVPSASRTRRTDRPPRRAGQPAREISSTPS